MLYFLLIALAVYGWTVVDLIRTESPEDFREVLGAVLACAVVAALWPLTLSWALALGPSPSARPD